MSVEASVSVAFLLLAIVSALMIVAMVRSKRMDKAGRRDIWLRYRVYLVVSASLLAASAIGSLAFGFAIACIVAIGLRDFSSIAGAHARLAPVLGVGIVLCTALFKTSGLQVSTTLAVLVLLLVPLFARDIGVSIERTARTLLGTVYIAGFSSQLLLLGEGDQLFEHFAFCYLVVISTDAFCLIWGRLLGKRKLSPTISPGKTLEGSMGGLASALVVGLGLGSMLPSYGHTEAAIGALVVSLSSQAGDLVASTFKRAANVKDYGNYLPAFGGVMDRFDSLIFSAPCFALFLKLFNL